LTARLLSKLKQTGFTEEQLNGMETADILNAFALALAVGHDKPAAAIEKPHAPQSHDPAVNYASNSQPENSQKKHALGERS
jgi:hypothetical protein